MAFENDPEGLKIAQSYAGRDFDKPKEVTIEALREYSGNWGLDEFQKLIAEAIEKIPADKRADASVDLDNDGGESTKLIISYRGLESAETVADRIRRCEVYVAERRHGERQTYERLKAKFG